MSNNAYCKHCECEIVNGDGYYQVGDYQYCIEHLPYNDIEWTMLCNGYDGEPCNGLDDDGERYNGCTIEIDGDCSKCKACTEGNDIYYWSIWEG